MPYPNLLGGTALVLATLFATPPAVAATGGKAFGSKSDVEYARTLWKALQRAKLVGPHRILAHPYKSSSRAHGAVLGTMKIELTVDGRSGQAILKNNYGPKNVSLNTVWQHPNAHLKSTTVMFKREKGYAQKSDNWFWVQYKPDGSLSKTKGIEKAGQVTGCISCHAKAKTGFVFDVGGK